MRHLTEYREPALVSRTLADIARVTTRPWRIMEVCGGQTHSIVKHNLQSLLPKEIELIHGPGCPVCVTPVPIIDQAITIARQKQVIFCSYGDMLRVPGSESDLLTAKAKGADVRIVYSPMDALALARSNPEKRVVMFAVGFETTAPAHALSVLQAVSLGVTNFSLLVAHVLVPPALEGIITNPACRVDGFLAAGHVCSVMGLSEYHPIAERYKVPIVATGFEPADIALGIRTCIEMLEQKRWGAVNAYERVVTEGGNSTAQKAIQQVFERAPREWRGMGVLPESGLTLRSEYAAFNAAHQFSAIIPDTTPIALTTDCRASDILLGIAKPHDCPAFGVSCNPDRPLGAPMVSSEGACAAYFSYRRHSTLREPQHDSR